MKVLISYLTLFFTVFALTPAFGEDLTIDMLNKRDDGAKMVYSQDIARIDVGDTITWVPTSKGHNVEFVAGPDSADLPKKPSKVNKEYTHTFTQPGIYLYQCSPHKSMGMIAVVIVGGNKDNLDAISTTRVGGKSKKRLAQILTVIS